MDIAHIITTVSRGGAELQLLLLAEEQLNQGHAVTVFPLKESLDLEKDFRSLGVNIDLSIHKKRFLRQRSILKRILKSRKIDVLHAHLPRAELLIASLPHKNKFCSRHFGGKFFPGRNVYLSRMLSRYATRDMKAVIAISESVELMLRKKKEVKLSARIVVVQYGFSSSRFKQKAERNAQFLIGENSEKRTFTCFARLSPEKNLIFLLRAWSEVHKKRPHWDLKIFGTGSQYDEVVTECRRLRLNSQEIFRGHTGNVEFELARSSAVIFPSQFEGFGMVLLEAMSVGVPIIASDIPICREVLGSDGAAVFFSLGQPAFLSKVLLEMDLLIKANFQEFQARRLVLYDIRSTAKKIEKVYLS